MIMDFKIVPKPDRKDMEIWGVMAHVTPEVRKIIIQSPALQKKAYIRLIEKRLKEISRVRRR